MRRSIDCKLFCWSNGGKKWYHDNNPKNWFASIHGDLWLPQVSNGDGHMAQSLILQIRKITDFRWKDMFQGTRYVCTYMILGFVCLMLGKNSKHILPDGGFDGDLPWYQVKKLEHIQGYHVHIFQASNFILGEVKYRLLGRGCVITKFKLIPPSPLISVF